MVGYDDQNWYLECADGSQYTLKIHNTAFSGAAESFEVRCHARAVATAGPLVL